MKSPRILVCRPNHDTPTETFIKNHAKYLDGKVTLASGPFAYINNKPSLFPNLGSSADLLKATPYWLNNNVELASRITTYCHINAIRKNRIQAALLEYGPHAANVMSACAKTNIPFLVHFHGSDAHKYETLEKYKHKYKELFQLACAIIVVSEPMRQSLLDAGAPDGKIHTVSCGVDTNEFCDANPADSAPICLAVGRLVEKKAPHLTILAFTKALEKCPSSKLILIGNGPLMGACQDLASHLGIKNSVEFLGFQPPDVVSKYMREARLFVQHSIVAVDGDSEGSPVSITEASASGLPIVSTHHAGIPQIVIDGETGYLVKEKDVDGMATAISELLDNPQKASEMGEAGRHHVSCKLNISGQIKKLDEIIRTHL